MLKLATSEDLPYLLDMAKKFVAASPYKDYEVDEQKVEDLVVSLLTDKTKSTVIVYIHDGKPVGMIAGTVNEFLFNRQKVASEIVWWVDPGFRSRKALSLKEAFEFWAKHKMGATLCHMASLNDDKVNRYYQRSGYKLTENTHVKEL